MPTIRACALVVMSIAWVPVEVYAQAAIAGTVRDSSGAVLPGVTVEASSAALIEGSRSLTTDADGQYQIVDLRPGQYSVTFTLSGFKALRRDGIQLTGTLTAQLNVALELGAVEETITVTGESPIVDVRSGQSEQRLNSDVLATVPTGRQYFSLALLVPGVSVQSADVGGAAGPAFGVFRNRGGSSDEGQLYVNGFPTGWQGFGVSYYMADIATADEVTFSLSGGSAEARTGGPIMNMIGRQGGNTFHGSLFANGASRGMASSNYTDAHRAAGLRAPNELKKLWDTSINVGGPIVRDRLWFFSSFRHQGNRKTVAGIWANLNAGNANSWAYEPDLSRQATDTGTWINGTTRLTLQATPRNKIGFFWDEQKICRLCLGGEGSVGVNNATGVVQLTSPEATPSNEGFPQKHMQATWTSPITNRVLVEAGTSLNTVQWGGVPKESVDTTDLIRVTEQAGQIPGLTYRAPVWSRPFGYTLTSRASVSYITGAHAAKVGYETNYYYYRIMNHVNSQQLAYQFNNGVPNRLSMLVEPVIYPTWARDHYLYVQDRWTRGRLTLQGGVRYEYIHSGFSNASIGGTRFMPAELHFDAGDSPVKMHDVSPRMAVAYDLFGTGKTAVRASFGRYAAEPTGTNYIYGTVHNPVSRVATTTDRSWVDANRNFVADCDLLNPAAQDLRPAGGDQCGQWSNRNFGTPVFATSYDPKVVDGWNIRFDTWDLNAGIQHELAPRVGVQAEYVRRIFGNFRVTDNRALSPQDYDPYCITAPNDPRLPSEVSGSQICDLYDVKPEKFGLTDNVVTFASNFGKQIRHYNGVNVAVNARTSVGLTVQGGISSGRTVQDDCDVRPKIDNPSARFCHVETPVQTIYNGLLSYTIPRIDVQVSGTWAARPVADSRNANDNVVDLESLDANQVVPNAAIAPSLGRNLAGGVQNVIVNLIEPGTLYGDWISNIDLRIAKILRFGQRRLMFGLDLYNLANSGAVLTYNQTFGPRWLTPTTILQSRFAKITGQFDF